MRFQQRDGRILMTIQDFDGILAGRHIHSLFWPDKSHRAMQRRLATLCQYHYLDRPSKQDWRTKAIPEPIYWLGWRGAVWLAGQRGLDIPTPKAPSENRLRRYQAHLRRQGLHWHRQPRWSQLAHDLAVHDFRLKIRDEVARSPFLTLEQWLPEGVFLAQMDVVECPVRNRHGGRQTVSKGVRPDGYFVIIDQRRQVRGQPARGRFLLELDFATHSNPKFGRQKVAPGVAYIKSAAYRRRFGANSGRWLVVTTGARRMSHLGRQTQQAAGDDAALFLFTTVKLTRQRSILTGPIWWPPRQDRPVALFQA